MGAVAGVCARGPQCKGEAIRRGVGALLVTVLVVKKSLSHLSDESV